MSKKLLIDRIEDQFESRAAADRAVDAVTAGITQVMAAGDRLVLKGFGTFSPKMLPERLMHNPRTMEQVKVVARRTVRFKPLMPLN